MEGQNVAFSSQIMSPVTPWAILHCRENAQEELDEVHLMKFPSQSHLLGKGCPTPQWKRECGLDTAWRRRLHKPLRLQACSFSGSGTANLFTCFLSAHSTGQYSSTKNHVATGSLPCVYSLLRRYALVQPQVVGLAVGITEWRSMAWEAAAQTI